jgi:hypothetical protein
MIKLPILLLAASSLISQNILAEVVDIRVIVDPYLSDTHEITDIQDPLWKEKFVSITFSKEMMHDLIVYHYFIKNIGNVSIGKIEIGYDANRPGSVGCQVPTENIVKLESSFSEFTVNLERQEENINKCIVTEDRDNIYYLEPGENMEITVYLEKDDPIFENLYWVVILGAPPTDLYGKIQPEIVG